MIDQNKNKQKDSEKINSLLKGISKKEMKKKETVVYGLYDNRNASVFTKIDDFLIDHTKISLKDKAYFFHLLAVMIDAGIPVLQALKILSGKTENRRFQRIINTLSHSTSTGNSLSDSMARFPDAFTDAEIGVVKAGEAAGNLNKMLFRLSDQIERSHELQVKLVTAATYPVVILITLIGITIGMMVWIVPTLLNLLIEGGLTEAQFPIATRILLAVSSFTSSWWWAVILFAMIMFGVYKVYKSTEVGNFQTDYFILKIPVIGVLIRKVLVLRFISLLGILLEAGLPVIKSLQIIGASINSAPYEAKTREVIKKVQEGEKISENLRKSPFLFPETITEMINIGESTASIGTISEKIAKHYDREIDHTLRRLTSLFEPMMILVVGIIVALLALAILMPIFSLTEIV